MFSSDKNVETIGQLVEVLKHYIGLRSEYMKLDATDKVVRLLTALIIGSLLLALLALALIYLSFAAAFAMADYVGLAPAFCIVYNSERHMYRVIASTFVDKAGAVKSRNELRAGKYPDAWLLLKK